MKAYLTKWIPPREDFLPTMTPHETSLIMQHGAWLSTLMEQGLVVAHGPVVDPAGGYGVAIWELGDEYDIAALTAQDPIVAGGSGHYEHYPMLQLRSRGYTSPLC